MIDFDLVAEKGVIYNGVTPIEMTPAMKSNAQVAMDAQPSLFTSPNAAVPAMLTTFVDPKVINVLFSPMKAAMVAGGEIKKGDWLTDTAMFNLVEATGEVSSYGDFSNEGRSDVNANYPQRQSYTYQIMVQYGVREVERYGLMKLDLVSQKNMAAALSMNKYQNKTYLFGVSGLQNYGLTNDPSLPTAQTPTVKAAGNSNVWITSAGVINATPLEILADFQKLFYNLNKNLNGILDNDSPLKLVMSQNANTAFTTATNIYELNAAELIKKLFPNLQIVTVPEYSTASGELVQLIADEVEGQKTVECAFTEKSRSFALVTMGSYYEQKKSGGTWGSIVYRPAAIQQMLGV